MVAYARIRPWSRHLDADQIALVCRPWHRPGGNFFQGEGYLADVFYPLRYPLLVLPILQTSYQAVSKQDGGAVRCGSLNAGKIIHFYHRWINKQFCSLPNRRYGFPFYA
jgi:hypothetical protein